MDEENWVEVQANVADPPDEVVTVRFPAVQAQAVGAAAELAGLDIVSFVRMAATERAAIDLAARGQGKLPLGWKGEDPRWATPEEIAASVIARHPQAFDWDAHEACDTDCATCGDVGGLYPEHLARQLAEAEVLAGGRYTEHLADQVIGNPEPADPEE